MNGFTDKCYRHPAHAAWNCPDCDEQTADPDVVPELAALVRAQMTRRTQPQTRPAPTPDGQRRNALRDQIDAEEARS